MASGDLIGRRGTTDQVWKQREQIGGYSNNPGQRLYLQSKGEVVLSGTRFEGRVVGIC